MNAILTLLLTGILLHAEDWPQFLGPRRDGSYKGKELPLWPNEGPIKLWKKDIGAGFAGPAIAEEKLILFHRINNRETVECLEAATGKLIWSADYVADYVDRFRFDNGPRAVPTIANGKVYTLGAHGIISAWDLKSGKVLWRVNARVKFRADKGYFGFACSPLVFEGLVLLNIGGVDGSGVVGLDAITGQVRWSATKDPANYASPILTKFGGKASALFFTRQGLVCLNPKTGEIFFKHHWRPDGEHTVNASTPIIMNNLIFVSASYGKGATVVEVNDGKLKTLWANNISMSCQYASCVIQNGYLYGFHGRQEAGAQLRCVELKTGRVLWSQPGLRYGTLTLINKEIWVLTERGEVARINASPKAYKVNQRAKITRGEVRAFPAIAQGRFYFRDENQLVCLRLGGSQ